MKNYITKTTRFLSIVLLLIFVGSCETTNLDINDNPNSLTIDSADPNFILNGIQITFATQHLSLSSVSSGTMRHENQFGTYANSSGDGTMNGPWANTYSITANLQLLQEISNESNLPNHIGMAQVLEAFAYVNLVDYIGTAVYSEAVSPEFPHPNLDDGESIYDAMFAQLDVAIGNLNATGSITPEDLFYDGDLTKWIKLANTLKLKMYLQTKLVSTSGAASQVNSILTSGNYINSIDDDFFVQFGTNITNPDTRHPFYGNAYVSGAGNVYMSNDFIYKLKDEKGMVDPRLNYYLYRQTLDAPTGDKLPCDGNPDYQYCYLGDGYWGRDHGDDEGIPNDGNQRTTYGIYPGGGAFDSGTGNTSTANAQTIGGAGIHPMLLSSFSKFMLAEMALPSPAGLGVNGNPRTYLLEALTDSFNKVETFSGISMNATDVADYTTLVMDEYDATATDAEKLNIIIREYYIASWGNSVEAYNNYRRTGYPVLGLSVITNTDFPRSYFLPSSELNSNDNPDVVQKSITDQVFWDTNPADFID